MLDRRLREGLSCAMAGGRARRVTWGLFMEKRLGNYVLKKTLGAGAFGTVWLAEHRVLHRKHAIKILNQMNLDELASADRIAAVDKFRAEARILADLDHPHIVSVSDAGNAADGR